MSKRKYAFTVLSILFLFVLAVPVSAKPRKPNPTTVSQTFLERNGYTCRRVGIDFVECEKKKKNGSRGVWWCSNGGKTCVPAPVPSQKRPSLQPWWRPWQPKELDYAPFFMMYGLAIEAKYYERSQRWSGNASGLGDNCL